MDTPRAIGTVLLCLYLPVAPIMLWIHLPERYWRRLGRRSYLVHAPVYLGMVALTATLYPWVGDGVPAIAGALRIPGAVLVVLGFVLLALTYRHIDSWTAMAGPQLTGAPARALITGGVYGVIRHPRYLVLLLGAWGNLFMFGGFVLALAAVVTTILVPLLVRVEERELSRHFGAAWDDYAARVPALVPRPRRARGTGR